MGSVKDLELREKAFENRPGESDFDFSKRYSIFDWGEMPDLITFKGAALATMAALNFELLAEQGISTHYKGLVDVHGNLISTTDLEEGSNGANVMRVETAVVYKPIERSFIDEHDNEQVTYDYSFFEANRGKINNYLIPLEIIFRNGLPLGSSVFRKLDRAKAIPDEAERNEALSQIYEKLGLEYGVDPEPKPGDMLRKPVIMYTTKLEAADRSLSEDEAYRISGLTEEQFAKVMPLALRVNDFISEQVRGTALDPHWDGKVEMRYWNGLDLVDVLGTLDENRMGDTSKEFMRQWYDNNQPEFRQACDEWAKTGPGWQERCPVKPKNLPTELVTLVSQMYMAATNEYLGRNIFDAPPLPTVMKRLEPFR